MSQRFSLNLGVIVAIGIALLTIGLAEHVTAQAQCPAGTQPATAADLPAMRAAGIPNPTVGECWNSSNQYTGQAAAQAKQDLAAVTCNSGVNIQGLDANFAVCADKFMQALRQSSPGACINSAYRSVQQQLTACMGICGASSCPGKCAPPGYSFHQKGLAIDVTYRVSNQQAWQIAMSSTNGGIANPSGLHSSDPAHFQATGSSCSGAPVPQSDVTDYYTASPSANTFFTPSGTNSQIPAGYCLVNTQPLVYALCTPPATQTQPAPITQPAPQTGQSSAVTTPSITPTSLTIATSNPSSILQPISPLVFATSSPSAQLLQQLTNPASAPASTVAIQTFLASSSVSGIFTLFEGNLSPQTNATGSETSSFFGYEQPYARETFPQESTGQFSAPSTTLSPLGQILQSLHSVLQDILNYL